MERLEVTMPPGEAIVDTGASQDLIRALSHRWAAAGLKAVKIDVPCGPVRERRQGHCRTGCVGADFPRRLLRSPADGGAHSGHTAHCCA